MTTFITRLDQRGAGPLLAVKDIIDVAGVPTTAGSKAVASLASPAVADAPLMAGARAAGCRLVGKANLHELAFGASGVNVWFGTPENPLDPRRVPGGSSSGSAVAVATGEAEVAYGSDTGGSVRVPSAFCGVTGLKTTFGRVPLGGVWPLAASLDTVGPMARDVAGVVLGMSLLEPGFAPVPRPASRVARLRVPGPPSDPLIEDAVDAALAKAELEVEELQLPEWAEAWELCLDLLNAEAAAANAHLLADPALAEQVSQPLQERLNLGTLVSAERQDQARAVRARWRARLGQIFQRFELLALPSVGFFAPTLEEAAEHVYTRFTCPVNLAGLPALALPVAAAAPLPASLQLIGPEDGEELLCATGAAVECAAGSLAGS